jgi:hypothetical protein
MAKSSQDKRKGSGRRKKNSAWQLGLAMVVIAALASSWILLTRETSSEGAAGDSADAAPRTVVVPGLENRMVLPATPRTPRPATLNPAAFDNPEVKASYQAAKDSPEALENVSCYCGCFGNSGHRSSLDCFTDNHGVT